MTKNSKFYLIFFLLIVMFFLPVKADLIFDLGKNVFLKKGNCATCHTLEDADSMGQIGPNLNEIRPNIKRVVSVVTEGIGVMPSFKEILSKEEIQAVAHYISISTN